MHSHALQAEIDTLLPLGLGGQAAALPPYEIDTACLACSEQAALLGEFARTRGLASAVPPRSGTISPRQLLALLEPLKAEGGPDAAFVIGRQSLPGHYGLASLALQQAGSLTQALRTLCRYAGRLSPLLTPRLLVDQRELIVLWTDACGLPPSLRGFVVDMHMSAVASFCAEQSGEALPWRFSFNRTAPRDPSQHAVFLGPRLKFDCQVDAMRLDLAHLHGAWPASPGTGLAHPALDRGADPQALQRGLLAALHDRLLQRLAEPPSLDELAADFGYSPATLKRRLAQHGSHYQAELDQLRAWVALYLLGPRGQANETVAEALGYFDSANFRRFFKRWTGLLPSAVRT
ncbi:AraC family transcriptional regulator [Pelomonas sp. HMWF004]|nr:AraC family transcriptional regulator [Pelomonas sp. HMWF004]